MTIKSIYLVALLAILTGCGISMDMNGSVEDTMSLELFGNEFRVEWYKEDFPDVECYVRIYTTSNEAVGQWKLSEKEYKESLSSKRIEAESVYVDNNIQCAFLGEKLIIVKRGSTYEQYNIDRIKTDTPWQFPEATTIALFIAESEIGSQNLQDCMREFLQKVTDTSEKAFL